MKPSFIIHLLSFIVIAIALTGCSIGYDQADYETHRRQDLIGYALNLKDPPPAVSIDPKWREGTAYMLANPQPLPADVAAHLADQ